jgi:hypothetical protein
MTLSIVEGSGSRFDRLTAPRKIEGRTGREKLTVERA